MITSELLLPMYEEIANRLSAFESIDLAQLDNVRLQNRVDTKFLLNRRHLNDILDRISEQYRVLVINDRALSRYRTLYFDTPDLHMYIQHHNDAGHRYKVRIRQYVETGVSFVEVKLKNNKKRTIKSRQQTIQPPGHIGDDARDFLAANFPIPIDNLEPKLWNSFRRITLASKRNQERVTLDLGLTFEVEGVQVAFPDIVIAEVKQGRFSVHSDIFLQMRRLQIRRMGFSKYCAGIARMYPHVKQNRFKERLLVMNKLSGLSTR